MKNLLPWILVVAVLSACGFGGQADGLVIGKAELLLLESFPVQVRLQVEGTHPACNRLGWNVAVDETQERIDVDLRTESDPQAECVSDRAKFKESIPLGSFETARYDVYLNGETIGKLELP